MLTVKNRLWGMYFFPGLVFTGIALLSVTDSYIEAIKSKTFLPSRFLIFSTILLIALLLIVVVSYWAPEFINSFIFFGTRTPSSPQFALPPWLMGV
jgi:polyferredoxin